MIREMISKLAKYIGIGALALASFFPSKADAQTINGPTPREVIGNTFSSKNIHMQVGRNALDYYGSGDVNNDETINQEDVNSILGSTSDRADIDGDGTPGTQADKSKLVQYLNGEIDYLPAHWNKLQTREERISWADKFYAIHKWDKPAYPGWVCADHIDNMTTIGGGKSNFEEYADYIVSTGGVSHHGENNARFNIPIYHVGTTNTSGISHAVTGILVGDNPLDFNDWYFVGYENDNEVKPGDLQMDANKAVSISFRAYQYGSGWEKIFNFTNDLILWELNNGEATMVSYKATYFNPIRGGPGNYRPPYVILDNPNDDKVNVQSLEEIIVNYEPNLTMTIPSLTAKGYNVMPDTTKENTTLPIEMTYEYNLINEDPNGFFSDWEFTTTGTISSGGVTNSGSGTQSVKVRDIEKPVIPYQGKITVLQEDFQEDANYYSLNATDNTEIIDSTKTLNLISEDDEKKLYELRGEVTDLGGNITEGKVAEIEVLKAKLSAKTIESKIVNYPGDTSPTSTGIPEYTTENTNQTPIYSYTDSDPTGLDVNYPEIHYEFRRTHTYTISTLSITSSSTQKITSVDLEAPKFTIPEDKILYENQIPVGGLNPEITGYPTNITDNSGLEVDTSVVYLKISENNSKINYSAVWSATDVFGNNVSKTQAITILKSSITISQLEDKLLNYNLNLDLTPAAQGEPTISTVNTQGTPKYSYFDADTTILNQTYPKINYSFIRYHIGAVDDIADSSLQKLTIADIEAPKNGVVPNNITITEELVETEGGLAPEITGGYVTGETDNSNLPIERVIDFTKISEDEEKEIYNATHKSTDQFGNDTTYTPQKVTVTKTPKATIKLAGLDDEVLINFEYGMSTDPIILGNLGYNAIPTVVVSDTNLSFTLTFNDGEREIISEQFPEVNYKFERVFIGTLVSGDNVDTAKQKITIADLEKPVVGMLEEITISKDDSLHPSVTGYPGITDNHGVKDTLFTYTLVTSSKTKEVYNAFVEAEDFFGNQAEDSLGNTKIKYQIVTRDLTTGIEDETELPVEFSLSQNYPNPFNPTTTIEYSIASKTTSEATHTKIVVLDILGREVAILLDEVQSPGNYSIKFDASSANGGLTSGMYFYRMQSESFVETKKLLLLK